MASNSKNDLLKQIRQRKYLNKDFQGFRADLLEYARKYYGEKIQDFTETGLGGLFLDLAAYVGDSHSFYLDHQFGELFVDTAVESVNVARLLRDAGVEIVGAAPAVVNEMFLIDVPATKPSGEYTPDIDALPIIEQGTVVTADNGTEFHLAEDLDFSKKDRVGNYVAEIKLSTTNADGTPATYIMIRSGPCVSGLFATETFSIPSTFVPFRTITLTNPDVTEISSVYDSDGNTYHEVTSLTQDTVFRRVTNTASDSDLVDEVLEMVPAPYRFVKSVDPVTRFVTLQFGGGNAQTLDDDIIPDPSEFAIPLYGKKTFSRFTIDPNRLLKTRTLGIAAIDTTLTVMYRHGGGLNHNVPSNTIVNITTLRLSFPRSPSPTVASRVRSTMEATNISPARGGDDALTVDELRLRIPSARNSQSRLVTRDDLLARLYTMPANFGRVYRAGIRSNPNNPLASQLFIISRDAQKKLVVAPDTLKKNVARYLNQFRLISDAIDILDARVVNVGIDFEIVIDPLQNKKVILQQVIARLRTFMDIKNFQIDQPIIVSDLTNIVFNTMGVVAVNALKVKNLNGLHKNRLYSESFDIKSSMTKGMIIGPPGSIFELRYADHDIQGTAV